MKPAMQGQWIWSGRADGHNDWRQVRHAFEVAGRPSRGELSITADALYQVWLNGRMIGHGPAKSAKGSRGIDRYDISGLLTPGNNLLEALVLNIGTGTMCYCPGEPGLCFDVVVDGHLVATSGRETLMRPDPARRSDTVRRWMLPCLEDVDAAVEAEAWQAAEIVERKLALYARRVPPASRQPLVPERLVQADRVRFPTFSISFRHKPYLVTPHEVTRQNCYATPAWFVTDILSPIDQRLHLTPTRGSVTWHHEGLQIAAGSGWGPWTPGDANPGIIDLKAGANRLIGVHSHDHFAEFNLAGYSEAPVRFVNPFGEGSFQVVLTEQKVPGEVDWEALRPSMPEMDPCHTMLEANAQDLVLGAQVIGEEPLLVCIPASEPLELPSAPEGEAVRLIVDLGMVHNGWLAFDVNGNAGSRLIFSFFEGIDAGPPLRLHWAYGCENALTYRLGEGPQSFESFHPYGVRYIAIHHTGNTPVRLGNLRVLTANCGSRPRGYLQCSDPLLNEIYAIAVQSVISSVDDTFTDCPTFEQVNWNFDNRTAFMGEVLSCANLAVSRHSIELFAEDPEFTGLVRSQYPSVWDNFIPLWSLHWIMWCRDYWWATGDIAFVKRLFHRIAAGVEEALGRIDARGLLAWEGVWHFVEWGHGRDDGHAVNGCEQAGLAGALAAAVELAEQLGDPRAGEWEGARRQLIEAVNRELWVPERGAYADSLHADGSLSSVSSQTTNAMMAVYGIASEDVARDLARRISEKEAGLLPYGSPYGLFYILELYDRFEMVEPIFAAIRHRWGDMVLAGDRTTWEHFAEFGGHMGFPTRSRCHPFAAYVIKYLVKYLMGIRAEGPAFASPLILPAPPRGITFCRGAIPTPGGLLRTGWRRQADGEAIEVAEAT